jgi:hypothetical protein
LFSASRRFLHPPGASFGFVLQHNLPQGRREVMMADGMEMERFVLTFQELPSVLCYTQSSGLPQGRREVMRADGRWHGIVKHTVVVPAELKVANLLLPTELKVANLSFLQVANLTVLKATVQ